MNHSKPLLSAVGEILQTALISLAIFLFVYVFIVQPHRIKGESMDPNFADGELVLTEKVSYYFGDVKRGDVVVFKAPNRNVDYIKRIIGLPGETIKIEDGVVFVNDQRIEEPYETQQTQGSGSLKLPDGEYFVLGDNRGSSSDSRSFGSIKRNSIKGRAWLIYFPIIKTAKSQGARIISRVHYSISNSLDNGRSRLDIAFGHD